MNGRPEFKTGRPENRQNVLTAKLADELTDFSLDNRRFPEERRELINQRRAPTWDIILARSRVRDKEIIAVTCDTWCARERRKRTSAFCVRAAEIDFNYAFSPEATEVPFPFTMQEDGLVRDSAHNYSGETNGRVNYNRSLANSCKINRPQ